MSLQSPTAHEHLARRRRRPRTRLTTRERVVVPLSAVLFLLAEAGLWAVDPPRHLRLAAALVTFAVLTLASRVRFETPFGFTTATQLAFVPLVFALPAALVAPVTCLALALGVVPDVLAGRVRASRLLYALPNCWFAIGPAWVIAILGAHHRVPDPLLLVAALAAQFVGDFAFSSLGELLTGEAGIVEQLRDTWVYVVDAALSGIGYVTAVQTRHSAWVPVLIVPLLGLLAIFARERSGRLDKLLELNETYRGTALLLGEVVEADDAYTGMHSQGVVALALAVGSELGLESERRRNLEFAALLHDAGKIAIPKEIINKPGALDAAEWTIMKTHSVEGERMLARVGGFMAQVGRIVRSHHERWDGRGYPDGLLGEAAPLEARIITACDSWSAMRTDRPYRLALRHEAAVAELVRHRGTQFDPRVADALLSVVAGAADEPGAVTAAAHDSPSLTPA